MRGVGQQVPLGDFGGRPHVLSAGPLRVVGVSARRGRRVALRPVEAQQRAADEAAVPLAERGGHLYSEAAIALIASLSGAVPGYHVVDVQNRGVLNFLPDNSVIETSCFVEKLTSERRF